MTKELFDMIYMDIKNNEDIEKIRIITNGTSSGGLYSSSSQKYVIGEMSWSESLDEYYKKSEIEMFTQDYIKIKNVVTKNSYYANETIIKNYYYTYVPYDIISSLEGVVKGD